MESIYGDALPELQQAMQAITDALTEARKAMQEETGHDPVEHLLFRIKAEDSMREKCRRKGLPETADSALNRIHDAIGIRVVCAFVDDVYRIRDIVTEMPDLETVEEKDYIRHAKPNGYRSLHLILRYRGKYYAEIQLRTISMDTWAALEHQLRYKKDIRRNRELLFHELKRCADELAATDISMQTLRNMIDDSGKEEKN